MEIDFLWLIIGGFGFLLRAWAVEIKLDPELQFRRHYLDRFLSYYAFIAIMFELESGIFNLLVLFTLPGALLALFALDIPFFLKFSQRIYWKEHKKIVWFERATLHLPGVILGVYLLIKEFSTPIESDDFILECLAACILILFPMFLMDHRIRYNVSKPQRIIIICIISLEFIALWCYVFFRLGIVG